jgi:hypothetical protein
MIWAGSLAAALGLFGLGCGGKNETGPKVAPSEREKAVNVQKEKQGAAPKGEHATPDKGKATEEKKADEKKADEKKGADKKGAEKKSDD